jgi:hypothetical protein
MTVTFSRRLALAVGVLLPAAETVRRWGTWQEYPPSLVDDYLAGAFLLYGAWRSGRDAREGQRYLAAAWAFTCGMGYMSFFGHLKNIHAPDPAPIPHAAVTAVIGLGWALAIIALWASLRRVAETTPGRQR